jgi:hypothetical protein
MGSLQSPFLFRCDKSTHAGLLAKWKCLRIFLLGASPEVLESSSLEFPEPGLGAHYTPSPNELASLMTGLGGLANGWPRTCLSCLSLSRD